MYFKIISTTILVLLVWLIMLQNQHQVAYKEQLQTLNDSLRKQQAAQSAVLEEQLMSIQETLEKIESKNRDDFDKKIANQERVLGLYRTLSQLSKSDRLAKAGQMPEATELVLSTKEAIWKAGDTFPEHKSVLHGMMGPIDQLASQWKANNQEGSAHELILKIDNIMDELGK